MDNASTIKNILSAVTDTTTSEPIEVGGAEKITLMLTASAITSGNGVFTVTGSIDGETYVAINTLIDNLTNTNTQNYKRVASKTISTNISDIVALDLEPFGYNFIKVKATVTTDGAYSAKALIEYC